MLKSNFKEKLFTFTFSLLAEKVAGIFEKVQEHSMRSRDADVKSLVRNKLFFSRCISKSPMIFSKEICWFDISETLKK